MVFSSAPLTCKVTTILPNGSTASTCPRVIRYGGGVDGGQKPVPPPTAGQVSRSRRPPELVTAKSALYVLRMASVTASPTSDSHSRPSARPQTSERRISTLELPITVPRIGVSCAVRSLIRAWIAGSGVTPMTQGLWKSAVLYTTDLVLVLKVRRTRVK